MRSIRTSWRRLLLLGCGICIFSGMVLMVATLFLIASMDHSPWDDGPFTGAVVQLQDKHPDSFIKSKEFIFECYNQIDEQSIISSKTLSGKQIGAWQITTGRINDWIQTCNLYRIRHKHNGYIIHGTVVWTYGEEHATFYFNNEGKLTKFYLSW